MPRSTLTAPIPNLDLPSFLLDGIPDRPSTNRDQQPFHTPFLLSAEDPERVHLSLCRFKHLVKCFAAGLQRAGISPGERVMLVSFNYIHAIVVALGVIAAGGILCTSQPDFTAREYLDQFKRDEPALLLVADEEPLLSSVLAAWTTYKGTPSEHWLFTDSVQEPDYKTSTTSRHWSGLIDETRGPGFQWRRLQTEAECRTPCQLFYTSGTEGLRKAAIATHRSLVAAFVGIGCRVQADVQQMLAGKSARPPPSTPRKILHTISIARGFGTSMPLCVVRSSQRTNAQLYFMKYTGLDMRPYLRAIETLGINEISCAPFTLSRLVSDAKNMNGQSGAMYDLSTLSSVTVTGAPSSQATINSARSFFLQNKAPLSLRVERAYAVTEAGSMVSTWRMSDAPDLREGCQGRLEPNFEVKIMTYDSSREAPTEVEGHESGEIWLKSPSCFEFYFHNERASTAAFSSDGWYRTGDLGYFKDDKLFLVGRIKESLKTPDNIPPSYIENVLSEHPDIIDAGVVGVYEPSKELQLVRAYVVLRNGASSTPEDVQKWMATQTATTAHLTGGVVFVDSLPRNNLGKLLRHKLNERAAGELGRTSVACLTLAQA